MPPDQLPQFPEGDGPGSPADVRVGDLEQQAPLPEQRPIGGQQPIVRVVDRAGGLSSCPVQFHDLEVQSCLKVREARRPDVIAAKPETGG